jgi:hypothetical protein
MIEEGHPGVDGQGPGPAQIELDLNIGFGGFSGELSFTGGHQTEYIAKLPVMWRVFPGYSRSPIRTFSCWISATSLVRSRFWKRLGIISRLVHSSTATRFCSSISCG